MSYKKLLFNLACSRSVQRNNRPRSFCSNLALRALSVQKRARSDLSLYRSRVWLIRSHRRDGFTGGCTLARGGAGPGGAIFHDKAKNIGDMQTVI